MWGSACTGWEVGQGAGPGRRGDSGICRVEGAGQPPSLPSLGGLPNAGLLSQRGRQHGSFRSPRPLLRDSAPAEAVTPGRG